jgi:hypothetical protein
MNTMDFRKQIKADCKGINDVRLMPCDSVSFMRLYTRAILSQSSLVGFDIELADSFQF